MSTDHHLTIATFYCITYPRCEFIWLMDCDYRGMIPTSIIEIAMPLAQLQMIECINKLAEK